MEVKRAGEKQDIRSNMQQAAALPFRYSESGELEILLITSRRSRKWIIPKGRIERGDTAAATAAREAFEEAGISGTLSSRCIGSFFYDKQHASGGHCRTEVLVFPLAVAVEADKWAEDSQRDKAWVLAVEAINLVDNDGLQTILLDFQQSHHRSLG